MKRPMMRLLCVSLLCSAPLQGAAAEAKRVSDRGGAFDFDAALFREKEVTVGAGQWALPGTLTLPAKEECCAVVLVHGWGPHNRDESFGPNRPFRDLAWGLASRGIAVLRATRRGRRSTGARSTGNVSPRMRKRWMTPSRRVTPARRPGSTRRRYTCSGTVSGDARPEDRRARREGRGDYRLRGREQTDRGGAALPRGVPSLPAGG